VGGNLARQFAFDESFNSKNIVSIRGREFDLLVCGGVSAVKWWANQNPDEDRRRIDALLSDLASVRARKVVVLSTIDVYPVNRAVDESFDCHALPNHAYGAHRLYFEDAMKSLFGHAEIVRIAGVFGPGLKKNVIYDLLHDNCLDAINPDSSFQYYNISNLWRDLQTLDQTGIRLINFVTEPIRTRDIIDRFFAGKPVGEKCGPEVHYDVHTLHGENFGGPPHYLADAAQVMRELGEFVKSVRPGASA
jgi:nucleoside-diphosphate-sugar epimerase